MFSVKTSDQKGDKSNIELLELNIQILNHDSVNPMNNKMIENKITASDTNVKNSPRKPRRRIRVRTRLSEFADYTSTHAIGHIKRVNHPPHKIFWGCCLLGAVGYFAFQVFNLVTTYIAKDYTVLVDIKFDRQLKFPAVTVCNLNPIRKEALLRAYWNNPLLYDILKDFKLVSIRFDNSTSHSEWNDTPQGGGNNRGARNSKQSENSSATNRTFRDDASFWENNVADDEFDDKPLIEELLVRLGRDKLIQMGHQLQTMLLDCDFQGIACSPENFTRLYNANHGNCFTYNMDGRSPTTSRPGPKDGLTLDLYLETQQYMYEVTEGAGAIITVHDQNEVPLPDQSGFLIAPGFETRIGITRFELERLGDPYYPCWSSSTSGVYNIFQHIFPNSYTYTICLLSCYQSELVKRCGCGEASYPLDSPYFHDKILPCRSRNSTETSCQKRVFSDYEGGAISCHCEQSCNQIIYKGSISSVLWPVPTPDAQANLVDNYLGSGHPSINTLLNNIASTQQIDAVRNNVAKVHIYYEELNYEKVYQKPAYTEVNLISDIGGNMGMFVGMSLITLAEYGELLVYIIYDFICKVLGRPVRK